ncbi:hypothetical protein ACQ33O_12015 [Ferruginibacter sp. SUN002]|uniref:hypothetical protein n=1 Tax=Ferruginibacter sp. SUN002 TaxID=2937789 RepID=UPI003D35B723
MKKSIIILSAFILSCSMIFAQGNGKGKAKGKSKAPKEAKAKHEKNEKNDKDEKDKHNSVIWGGTSNEGNGNCKSSKNQPRKVRDNFKADYPNAVNVEWCKYRGDWTATFSNRLFGRSTAVYHANGKRKDTRSVTPWIKVPRPVATKIESSNPTIKIGDVVKIELPKSRDIFRIPVPKTNGTEYLYYEADGTEVKYDY